jgi:N-acetylneuraminate synthase
MRRLILTKTNIIAEIGINHNGSVDICKKLISTASVAGCDYVKIQKRTPDICVPQDQKNKIRSTPWGEMTYLDYKKRIEFNEDQISELIQYAQQHNITLFASVWDIPSSELMSQYCTITKIPSALITDIELCKHARDNFNTLIISTGMSTEEEIEKCVEACEPDVIMHTNSTYPCPVDEINLKYINWLHKKWPNKQIGYSGHEYGLVSTFASVAIGASWIERHITLNHNMWGSDHLSSLEPSGLFKLVKGIRDVESSMTQEEAPRVLLKSEQLKRESLRK